MQQAIWGPCQVHLQQRCLTQLQSLKKNRPCHITVIFGDDSRFSLEAAVMGASLKARTKMDMVCLHTDEVPEVWRQGLASVGWLVQEVQHVEYSPQV